MATTTTNYGFDVPTSSDLVKNGATAISTLGQDIDTFLFRPFSKNAVINGAMDIWQRGTSIAVTSTSTSFYGADRWQVFSASTGRTVSRQATGDTTNLPNIQYCQRVSRYSGNSNTAAILPAYSMETADAIRFVWQPVVLSFYARKGANYSATGSALTATIRQGTGTDQNLNAGYTGSSDVISSSVTLTTTWQRFQITGTLLQSSTELGLQFNFTPTGTAGAADYFEITGVQLEVGSQATPFSRNAGTIQGELAACQRYYQKSYDTNTAPQTNGTNGGLILGATQSNIPHQNYFMTNALKVEMRTAPTVTVYSYTSSTAGVVSDCNGVDKAANSGTAAHIGTRSFNVYNNSGGTIATANGGFVGHYVASAEL